MHHQNKRIALSNVSQSYNANCAAVSSLNKINNQFNSIFRHSTTKVIIHHQYKQQFHYRHHSNNNNDDDDNDEDNNSNQNNNNNNLNNLQSQQLTNYSLTKYFKAQISKYSSNKSKFDFCPLTDDKLTNVILPGPNENPLQHTWTFWYLKLEKNFSWEHSQLDIATFSTIESFWSIFDSLLPLSETHHGCNYSIFKKGIRPIWEDPMNRNGGRFIFSISKENENYKIISDFMWIEFCMLIIGNSKPKYCEQICGIVGGNRNNLIKIAVWTKDSECKQKIANIGAFLFHFYSISNSIFYRTIFEKPCSL